MRQQRFLALIFALALVAGADVADADVLISVNKTTQELTVSVDGSEHYKWPVSTARAGYVTPNGNYRPIRLDRTWFSRKYDNSPMPYSIFFHAGYAIHGSYERRSLGRPASHGCVRLDPKNAEKLFELVKAEGPDKTRIVVSGSASSVDRVEPRLTSSPNVSKSGDVRRALASQLRTADRGGGPPPIVLQARSVEEGVAPQLVDPFSELFSYVRNHSR